MVCEFCLSHYLVNAYAVLVFMLALIPGASLCAGYAFACVYLSLISWSVFVTKDSIRCYSLYKPIELFVVSPQLDGDSLSHFCAFGNNSVLCLPSSRLHLLFVSLFDHGQGK